VICIDLYLDEAALQSRRETDGLPEVFALEEGGSSPFRSERCRGSYLEMRRFVPA
jgi:hypothetical protein